jgi:monoamine oxidase
MNRRHFLKQSTLVSIGGLLIPPALLSACQKETLFEDVNFDGTVLIIGAGAAGLYAGYLLNSMGIKFQILEASDHIGGRMGKLSGFADYTIDTGAQWLHGQNNLLGDLIKAKNIKTTLDDSELSYWFENQIVDSLPQDPFIFEARNLPDISFRDYGHQQGLGTEYDNIVDSIAGDQGASATLLSAYWNSKDEENWVSGDEDFKFEDSFFEVIEEHIAGPIMDRIIYYGHVQSIDYSADKVIVRSMYNEFTADKVIVTVPISILKLNEISFTPALPAEKTDAFSKIGMGPGIKVFLKFSTNFYRDGVFGGSRCTGYFDDTLGKTTSEHILVAFAMGDKAATLSSMVNSFTITNSVLQELDRMYNGRATASFLNSRVIDYTSMPFIKGAYSYSTIGMGDARQIAAKSIDGKLYFAGEAMNTNGHHQTVHGAMESGYKAVINILKDLKG